jgi:hypothetical protein
LRLPTLSFKEPQFSTGDKGTRGTHVQTTEGKLNCGEDAGKLTTRNMSTTGTSESAPKTLVEQPREGATDGVNKTEEQRLQEVKEQRVKRERKEEASRRIREELEKL